MLGGERSTRRINQSKVKSGFDVEALLGERYLTYILLTALDAGVLPLKSEIEDPHLIIRLFERSDTDRLYEPNANPDGTFPDQTPDAFDVEILFDHPSGADLRTKVILSVEQVGGQTFSFVPIDLFVTLSIPLERDPDGALIAAGLTIHVVDFDSPVLPIIEAPPISIPKADLLAKIHK